MKTYDLIGPALDWAVAKCEGAERLRENPHRFDKRLICRIAGRTEFLHDLRFSTDWAQGGPIIERELIDVTTKFINAPVEHPNGQWAWQASCITEDDKTYWFDGPTPLIAAMRCYVASKLGDEVEIPEK
jgi:hypothetical protein